MKEGTGPYATPGEEYFRKRKEQVKDLEVDVRFPRWKSGKETTEVGILRVIGGDVREISRPRSQGLPAVLTVTINSLEGF